MNDSIIPNDQLLIDYANEVWMYVLDLGIDLLGTYIDHIGIRITGE